MHFGQFNLMGYRTPGAKAHELYDNAIEQVKVAEANGFEIAWFAEHHFSNYCVCPSPLMMLARLAGETKRIKLGSAVVVTPLYQPVRLISEVGMVDALSHGRLVLGVGSGYQPYEFERFGEALEHSVPKLFEFMEMLELAFSGDTFSYQGKYFTLPETHIASRPFARLPEIWVAGDNAQLHQMAARKGWTVMLTPRHASIPQLLDMRRRLADIYASEGLDRSRVAIAPLRHVCITTAKAEAQDFIDNVRHQIRLSQSLRFREELIDGTMLVEKPYKNEPPMAELAQNVLVGDAETVAERLVALVRAARPKHMLLHFQAGASPQKTALRSIEAFAERVRPMLEKALGPLDRLGIEEAA
ncbi:MAG TPA: LLM class flavin-dependent oxidoreductase [Hyphomicrobiaceae bacterium]|jgi:alkanesulfonate monooxygenase SsuD/methylene tetrahydromethanopterin reductase-like flavin-dependent oxidoreductase (luciferase family)|nr:LLM class flavin-dependent oxidoreductase [Hyphomicrobiaceae bacterium]